MPGFVDIVGLRRLRRGFGLIQAVEVQVLRDKIPVGDATPGVKFQGLLYGSKGFIVFAKLFVNLA